MAKDSQLPSAAPQTAPAQACQNGQRVLSFYQVTGGGFACQRFVAPDAKDIVLHLKRESEIMPKGAIGVLSYLIPAAEQSAPG